MKTPCKKTARRWGVALFFLALLATALHYTPSKRAPAEAIETTDFIIVTTNSPSQAAFWQSHLDERASSCLKYIVIYEDWPGGADNGLGSLYAFLCADERAKELYGVDLKEILAKEGGVCLFHCAGMGKRLYPLTASEYNNKSAIKIPAGSTTQSILDLVLDQTLAQTALLKGRLSVFWGDQVFIPSVAMKRPKSHAEVFTMVSSFPSKNDWITKNLDNYGLFIIDEKSAKLVEKTSYSNLLNIVANDSALKEIPDIGVSLGSFSISFAMLKELLETFRGELVAKSGKLNSDYHFWMPLTWTKDSYLDFMQAKGYCTNEVVKIYERMQIVKEHLQKETEAPVFGVQNIGGDALWWDFGNLKSYYNNLMGSLFSDDRHGEKLAEILQLKEYYHPESNSIIINCHIDELHIRNSILVNVTGRRVLAQDSIVVNAVVDELATSEALIYNVSDRGPVELARGEVRADIFFEEPPHQVTFYSSINRNNKDDWKIRLPKNQYAFEEIYQINESLINQQLEECCEES